MTSRGTRWAHTDAFMTMTALDGGRALIGVGAREPHGVTFLSQIAATSMRLTTIEDPTDATMTQIAKVIEHALIGAGAAATTIATEISNYD